MKKNILIIGHGNISQQLSCLIDKNKFKILSVSRNNKYKLDNHIEWNWTSNTDLMIEDEPIESIVFFPKPSDINRDGYEDGFIKSAENIYKNVSKIRFNKFITVSSTRVYEKKHNHKYMEIDSINPKEYRGILIKKYENIQKKFYKNRLIILRFAGLYDDNSKNIPKNHLHRKNAARIIKFFIENKHENNSYEIFNCCEDNSESNISNEKLKNIGFIYKEYH